MDICYQADKLLSFARRGGDTALWWRSKDFTPQEERAIREEVRRLQEAKDGVCEEPEGMIDRLSQDAGRVLSSSVVERDNADG